MGAMLNKAESAGVLLNLPKLYGFLHSVASSLTVDSGLSHSEMFSLAHRLHSMSPKNVNLLTVPLSNTNYLSPAGSAVLWNPSLSKRLFHDFAADKPITNVVGKQKKLTVAPRVLRPVGQNTAKMSLGVHIGDPKEDDVRIALYLAALLDELGQGDTS